MIIWKMGGICLQCRTSFKSMDVHLGKFGQHHKDVGFSLGSYSNFRVNVPGMHYVNEDPHKDSCVCVCVCEVVLIS